MHLKFKWIQICPSCSFGCRFLPCENLGERGSMCYSSQVDFILGCLNTHYLEDIPVSASCREWPNFLEPKTYMYSYCRQVAIQLVWREPRESVSEDGFKMINHALRTFACPDHYLSIPPSTEARQKSENHLLQPMTETTDSTLLFLTVRDTARSVHGQLVPSTTSNLALQATILHGSRQPLA